MQLRERGPMRQSERGPMRQRERGSMRQRPISKIIREAEGGQKWPIGLFTRDQMRPNEAK